MERQQANIAIIELIESKEFKQCISKVKPEYLQADLTSEVYLALLETAPEKITALQGRNELRFYAARIIFNMAFSNTSPFYKKYRGFVMDYKESYKDYYDDEGNLADPTGPLEQYYDRINQINLEELFDESESKDRKKLELLAFSLIDNLYWYDAQILKLYLYYGDYRRTAQETRIPFTSIYCTVQKAAKEIKELLKGREIPNDNEVAQLLNKIESVLQIDSAVA